MQIGEIICEYCNSRYPDKRSLKIHEFIHIDQDDYFDSNFGFSGQLDYLPKAKNMLPSGIRNNRFIELKYTKVPLNVPRYGKRYFKQFFMTETIDELIYLCKKYPLRKSTDLSVNSPDVSNTVKMPPSFCFLLKSASPISIRSSTSSSGEFSSYDSESDQNKKSIKERQNIGHQIPTVSRSLKRRLSCSSSDSGYGSSPQRNDSERTKKDSDPVSFKSETNPTIEVNNVVKDLISRVAVIRNCMSINFGEYKSIARQNVTGKFFRRQNKNLTNKKKDASVGFLAEMEDSTTEIDNVVKGLISKVAGSGNGKSFGCDDFNHKSNARQNSVRQIKNLMLKEAIVTLPKSKEREQCSSTEIRDLMKDIVSPADGGRKYKTINEKLTGSDKFKPIVRNPVTNWSDPIGKKYVTNEFSQKQIRKI